MAVVDQFLQRHVQGALEAGEVVHALGLMRRQRRTSGGQHVVWDDFLAVGTDRRLIVFESETSGVFTPTAQMVARSPREFRYDELQNVRVEPIFGVTTGLGLGLSCHPYLGPDARDPDPEKAASSGGRYSVFAACDALDGQQAFHGQYLGWLAQAVNAGNFPLPPEKRAWVESKMAERRAAIAAEQQRVLQRAAERDAKIKAGVDAVRGAVVANRGAILSIGSLVAVILVGLAGAATGGVFVADAIEELDRDSGKEDYLAARTKMLERDLATWASSNAEAPPTDCPEDAYPKAWKRFSYAPDKECHACTVEKEPRYPVSAGYRRFDRGGASWTCPPASYYREQVTKAKRDARNVEDELQGAKVQLGIGAVVALVSLLLIPIGLLVRKKLLGTRRVQPPGPPMLGAPGAPG